MRKRIEVAFPTSCNDIIGFIKKLWIPADWTRFGQLYREWRAKNITGRDFMRKMDMSANIFYRLVREYEIRNGITELSSAWQ